MLDFKLLIDSLDNYDIFEGMTSISALIKSIIEGSNTRRIVAVMFDKSRVEKKQRELSYLLRMSSSVGFELVEVDSDKISALTSGETHGGIIAVTTKRILSDNLANLMDNGSFFALIDGVEDPYNFGYSVRSLYAAGVDGIILSERNWMEFSGVVARSSAGTSELANIVACDTYEAVKFFKDKGFKVVCASIRDSVSLCDYDFTQPVLLIVGGEKRGISRSILEKSDSIIRIDYGRQFKGSLPSVSATSIISCLPLACYPTIKNFTCIIKCFNFLFFFIFAF